MVFAPREVLCSTHLASLPDATPYLHARPSSMGEATPQAGDYVKVGYGCERFWCKVDACADGDMFCCTVDNDLQSVPPTTIKYGDVLTLSKLCILEVATINDGLHLQLKAKHLMACKPSLTYQEACLKVMSDVFAFRPRIEWPNGADPELTKGVLPDGSGIGINVVPCSR
jgi:hypothetical protein